LQAASARAPPARSPAQGARQQQVERYLSEQARARQLAHCFWAWQELARERSAALLCLLLVGGQAWGRPLRAPAALHAPGWQPRCQHEASPANPAAPSLLQSREPADVRRARRLLAAWREEAAAARAAAWLQHRSAARVRATCFAAWQQQAAAARVAQLVAAQWRARQLLGRALAAWAGEYVPQRRAKTLLGQAHEALLQEAWARRGARTASAALGAWRQLAQQAGVRHMAAYELLARAQARQVLLSWHRGAALSRWALGGGLAAALMDGGASAGFAACDRGAALRRCAAVRRRWLARLVLAGWRAHVGRQVQKRVNGAVAQALRGLLLLRKAWAR
jgi:hypothetical protein